MEDSYNQFEDATLPQDLSGRIECAGSKVKRVLMLGFDKRMPNPNSVYQTEHLSYFKFVGRVVAKALFDGSFWMFTLLGLSTSNILGVKNDVSYVPDLTFSMDADEEKHILYEKTQVPLEGFKALQGISGPQKFQIHKAYGAPERLPSAHTCFNQLDLPEYTSRETASRTLAACHS
ncbi:hypothetical protein NC653_003840 [Populus alba x Populus x berolinensis]|uniref:HECT-type E3 ubiquitin transferase n=1 Tax=Populus alba x Populus x berolinensis TaxID=444605 RepID=A0AAD6WJ88_9ROSI|nr:hypothetical protein NC653_003840 [Populus alba x Populus x berolinensis]